MSGPDSNKRDYLLPPGCKDLFDALQKQEKEKVVSSPRYPPVTREVKLPEKVSVRFLAEFSGQDLHTITKVMHDLRIIVSPDRSVDFADAQKILRTYGIWAKRGDRNA